jgi:multidrug resistance protein MdtO
MTADALPGWPRILRAELKLDRARWIRMASMTGCATLLATVFLVFRVPLPAYGAYVVIMASQRDVATSVTMSIGALVAATAAIAFSILLYLFDIDEPALRIPAMAVVMFGAMYLSRAPRVGPIFFLTGFVLVVTQTLVDQIPDGETLTHLLLWLALIIFCACTIVPLVELVVGRKPSALFADGLTERAAHAVAELSARTTSAPTISVRELATQASRLGPQALRRLAAVLQIEQIASLRPNNHAPLLWQALASRVMAAVKAPGAGIDPDNAAMPLAGDEGLLYRAALDLTRQLENPSQDVGTPLAPLPGRPAHIQSVRFAFKATLAAMVCYIVYSGLDWSGIRTSIITCFFVALGSTGETVHKLSLRLTGALIGGVLAGLSIVFLFPVMDDIGGFIVLFASVTLLCTWVVTSSPLIAYAGLQMAFAFYLGVLQDVGPTDDLTVLRDRLAGIVLGNVAMSLVFATIWPVSTIASAKALLVRITRQQARLLNAGGPAAAIDVVATATDLEEVSRLTVMASFDLGLSSDRRLRHPTVAKPLSRVVAWSNAWLRCAPLAGTGTGAARRLESVAQKLEGVGADETPDSSVTDTGTPASMNQAIDALEQETMHAR